MVMFFYYHVVKIAVDILQSSAVTQ